MAPTCSGSITSARIIIVNSAVFHFVAVRALRDAKSGGFPSAVSIDE
jgi:hypothetical protein